MGYIKVAAGQVIESAHVNLAIDQGVLIFPSNASRDAQLPTPVEGQHTYIVDIRHHQVRQGGTWKTLGPLEMGAVGFKGGQAFASGAEVMIQFDMATVSTAIGKPGRMSAAADGSLTAPVDGIYLVVARFRWPDKSGGERRLNIQTNVGGSWGFGGTTGGNIDQSSSSGTSDTKQSFTAIASLAAGQKVSVWGRQDSGATLTTGTTTSHGSVGVYYQGPRY